MTSISQITTGVRQVAALLQVAEGHRDAATPCDEWTVADLSNHIVHTGGQFLTMARAGEVDWTASPDQLDDPVPVWDERSHDLLTVIEAGATFPLGMVAAELSVHTWDLAAALGRSTDDLEQSLAEEGFAFMSANLTEEQRVGAFDPETPAPEGANAYERLAAFAGRTVTRP
ncbi:TIGR03086 family protein [Aeromicrobium sp. Sec7.5]|uniref:TIGR03086 family protein n=1 Tax=Aeromicrobium sp. Sec7.5 TaxID=3121276 RepID=UPI002FE4B2FB